MKDRRSRQKRAKPHPQAVSAGAPAVGEEFEVEVERILPGGLGLAHAAGHTLMVALSAPGDRARVCVRQVRGRVGFASIEELLSPGPARTAPPCPYFGRCGGCDFQQLTYEAQLAAKVEIVRDCLRRVARLEPPADIHITPSPDPWRYRSRAQWQYDTASGALGYFERGTHRVCDVVESPVVIPPLQATLGSLRDAERDGSLSASVAEFHAVAGDEGVGLAPPVEESHAREQTRTIGGERYSFDAECFFQINHALLDALVREGLRDASGHTALDLYCGVGLFTLPLARRFTRVWGVEGNARAARFARRNLADAGLDNARVETAPVGQWLARRISEPFAADFVLLDPPRAGADPQTLASLIALRPTRISYVSCDPATLARDLRALTERGYRLASVHAFDMFPQTHHVETVVHLSRSEY
ncbi:MAG TPA: class I SAM-dependent RNA methyltransferase [Pyrinomonadaceae bacterium]